MHIDLRRTSGSCGTWSLDFERQKVYITNGATSCSRITEKNRGMAVLDTAVGFTWIRLR